MINAKQAKALAALMETGRLAGTTYPDVDPPLTVSLAEVDDWCDTDGAKTLGVLGPDGRAWQIVTQGITWPVEYL